jgi:tetratricopeptide (TPR) repeat protein
MTTATFWEEVRALFQEAAELAPRDRAPLLANARADVRAEVESLLAAHDEATPFLEESVWHLLEAQQGQRLVGTPIGPYRIASQLGSGGMGTVFLAEREHVDFTQRVAIKLVRGGEALVQRFRQERQILAGLEHPNIARLLDGGTTADGLPYLVMEYVEGTPIDAYAKALTTSGKLRLFLQLCDAVQYAHRSLVIHRDIKPANVVVTPDGIAKLLDFGIAKLAGPEAAVDATATRLMTPQYASPEQLLGKPVTTATDVYSLGVLLFELLTGRKPFDDQRLPNSEPPRPSALARALRGDLESILLAALEVDPAQRYGSVEKFADDVRRHLSGHPIAARRATFGYHAAKFVRRNLLAVAAGVAIVVIVAISFAATMRQKRIAERRFDEVRSLAGAVVYELHDAIAPLPGSTRARELLVRRALVYLDRLAVESEDNAPLRMELASAYLKIGDVQGLPYHANLGDTAGALASYRKAFGFAQAVSEEEPSNHAARLLLAEVHDRLGYVEQRGLRWAVALAHHDEARALRESLPRTPRRDIALAKTWTAIGDCRYIGTIGNPREAYEAALRTILAVPPSAAYERERLSELARAHQHLGGYFTGTREHDIAGAIRHHDAALQAFGARAALDPDDVVARRNYADQFAMKARARWRRSRGPWKSSPGSPRPTRKTAKPSTTSPSPGENAASPC